MLYLSFEIELQFNSIDTGKRHRNQSSMLIPAPQNGSTTTQSMLRPTAFQHLTTRARNCPETSPPRRRWSLGLWPSPSKGNRCPRRRPGRPAPPAAAQLLHAPRPTGMNPAALFAPPRHPSCLPSQSARAAAAAATAATDGVMCCEPGAGQA